MANRHQPSKASSSRSGGSVLALVADEVDVHARVALPERRREPGDPGLVGGRLLGTLPDRADRYAALMRFSGPHAAARSPEGLAATTQLRQVIARCAAAGLLAASIDGYGG